MAQCKSERSDCTASWCRMVRAGPGRSPHQVHEGSCVVTSCCMNTLWSCSTLWICCSWFSSLTVFRSSRVDSHNLSRMRPCTVLRWLRASSLNQASSPVDGISDSGMFTEPRKSSCEPWRADWHTCLKKRPSPRTPRTSFSRETASMTQLSSSWSQMSRWKVSVLMSSMSLREVII